MFNIMEKCLRYQDKEILIFEISLEITGKIYRFPMYAYRFLGFVYPEKRPYCLHHERNLKRSIHGREDMTRWWME